MWRVGGTQQPGSRSPSCTPRGDEDRRGRADPWRGVVAAVCRSLVIPRGDPRRRGRARGPRAVRGSARWQPGPAGGDRNRGAHLRGRRVRPTRAVVQLLLLLLLAWLVVEPIAIVALEAVRRDGAWTLDAVRAFFVERNEWRAAWNSAWLAVASVVGGTLIGVPLALLTRLIDFPGRRVAAALLALPAVLPPLVGVVAFLFLYGESGVLSRAVMLVSGASTPPWRSRCRRGAPHSRDHDVRLSVSPGTGSACHVRHLPARGGDRPRRWPDADHAHDRVAAAASGHRQRRPPDRADLTGVILGPLRVRRGVQGASHPGDQHPAQWRCERCDGRDPVLVCLALDAGARFTAGGDRSSRRGKGRGRGPSPERRGVPRALAAVGGGGDGMAAPASSRAPRCLVRRAKARGRAPRFQPHGRAPNTWPSSPSRPLAPVRDIALDGGPRGPLRRRLRSPSPLRLAIQNGAGRAGWRAVSHCRGFAGHGVRHCDGHDVLGGATAAGVSY